MQSHMRDVQEENHHWTGSKSSSQGARCQVVRYMQETCASSLPKFQVQKPGMSRPSKPERGKFWEAAREVCVYFAFSPFARLVKAYMREQEGIRGTEQEAAAQGRQPLMMTAAACGCMQIVVEAQLVEILETARYMIRQTTNKKRKWFSTCSTNVIRQRLKDSLLYSEQM